jgi:hypothetical protein
MVGAFLRYWTIALYDTFAAPHLIIISAISIMSLIP